MQMRKFICLIACIAICFGQAFAQNRTISGKVSDDKGAPLAGVTVAAVGADARTLTDDNGNFSIVVSEKVKSLRFSFVGYQSAEINVTGKSSVTVSLTNSNDNLEEVVVVGYGVQRKKEVTGSVASVKGAAIASLPVQSFDAALGGRATGVQITVPNGVLNNPPVFRIRGTNSINLSSYPLIVIDGVPSYTGDVSQNSAANNPLASINPADIESIEILKDASAAAIYGSRAANGIVQITTKRGKAGASKVTYEGTVGWTSAYGLWDLLNAEQYMTIKNEGLANANITNQQFRPTVGPDGKNIDTRWYDYVYRTGFQQNHNVNVSGGNA